MDIFSNFFSGKNVQRTKGRHVCIPYLTSLYKT